MSNLSEQIAQLETDLTQTKAQLRYMYRNKDHLESTISNDAMKYLKMHKENEDLKKRLATTEKVCEGLKNSIEIGNRNSQKIIEENRRLRDDFEKQKNDFKLAEEVSPFINEELTKEIAELKHSWKQQTEQYECTFKEKIAHQNKAEALAKEIANLQNYIKDLESALFNQLRKPSYDNTGVRNTLMETGLTDAFDALRATTFARGTPAKPNIKLEGITEIKIGNSTWRVSVDSSLPNGTIILK